MTGHARTVALILAAAGLALAALLVTTSATQTPAAPQTPAVQPASAVPQTPDTPQPAVLPQTPAIPQPTAAPQPPALAQAPAVPPTAAAPKIPGITAKDAYPNGCVDCHVAAKDGDTRISVLIAQWTTAVPAALVAKAKASWTEASKIKGKHMAVANVKANIPQSCLATCHKKGSTIAPSFAQLLHTLHLAGGAENKFLTVYKGDCTHCHKLDLKTGAWKMPSGPEK